VVAARVDVDRSDVDAFSVWYPDRPVIVLGADKGVTARSRFDAAHELGHLVVHEPGQAETKVAEQQAHWFAAAFLLPADSLCDSLPRTADWRAFLDLKAEWGASIAALLRRAKTLGVMGDHTYLNAIKVMSARGWRRREPGDDLLGLPERPVLLQRALGELERAGLGVDDLARRAHLPVREVRRLFEATRDARPAVEI
jgi:Zn-dependent peptidase ImmA (M78 family)